MSQSSFFIIGGSVAGLALNAHLKSAFPDSRVQLISDAPKKSRRLIKGCSLRYAAIQRLSKCFGCTPGEVITSITGGKGTFSRVSMGIASAEAGSQELLFCEPIEILRSSNQNPAGLSTRHGNILDGLEQLGRGGAIYRKTMSGVSDLLEYGMDANSTIINSTPFDFFDEKPAKAKTCVVAAQAPMIPKPEGIRPPLQTNEAYAPIICSDDGLNVAFFTPFYDPLSPEASWYGINTRIISMKRAEENKEYEIKSTVSMLKNLSDSLGLELLDEEETLGSAVVPVFNEKFKFNSRHTLDVHRGFSSGAPAIYVDGMLAMATGALSLVDSMKSGSDLSVNLNASLKGIRFRNLMMQWMMFSCPPLIAKFMIKSTPSLLTRLIYNDWVDPI